MAPRNEVNARIEALARGADIEVIPLKNLRVHQSVIPKETTVAVTCSVKLGLERTIEHAERFARDGHRVRPHIAARQVPDRAYLGELVERLRDFGAQELHVIGGDAEQQVGKYGSAVELVEDLSTMDHGLMLSVACYPEGHPSIPERVLFEALQKKQPHVSFMINQLCFDARALIGWLSSMRAAGITLPLRMGLAPPINPAKLLDISLRIGVGASARYLSKQHGFLGNLLRGKFYKPERLLNQLGDALVSPEMSVDGLHIFSFNQVQAAVDWQRKVGRLG
jgi:methylenetetrahydrofolate reductase (NADPH)